MLREAIPMLHALGGAIGRALRVAGAIEAHQPEGRFWYLHIAGCDPVQQGHGFGGAAVRAGIERAQGEGVPVYLERSEEHTSELQSLMRMSYAVFCLKKNIIMSCLHTRF